MTYLEKLIEEKETDLIHFYNVAAAAMKISGHAFYDDWLEMREIIEDIKQEITCLKQHLAIDRWKGEVCFGI